MYGQDAVIPIVRTDIGNIAMSAVQFEPELFRCMAFKGAEIMCRVATGGFEYEDMRLARPGELEASFPQHAKLIETMSTPP